MDLKLIKVVEYVAIASGLSVPYSRCDRTQFLGASIAPLPKTHVGAFRMMSTLYTVLQQIRETPGMYLGRPSVSDLFMFLNGYEVARSQMGYELDEDELLFFDGFQPWLQKRLGVKSVTSWAKLVMLSCPDERVGFERFFGLLDEFLGQSEQPEARSQ